MRGHYAHLVYQSVGPTLCGETIAAADEDYASDAPECPACNEAYARHIREHYGIAKEV